jgi:hypothetical protein
MNRLEKFVEKGERPGRIAYVLDRKAMPEAATGLEWRVVSNFSPGDALLENPGLKAIFEEAIRRGCAVVTPNE